MEKNLYIDASHPNETRVVLKSGENIEDYEYEGLKNNLIKNNIYLGKVSRIEPSLQAAFVDFGRERHGLLSFNDIQSDYYQFFCLLFYGISQTIYLIINFSKIINLQFQAKYILEMEIW